MKYIRPPSLTALKDKNFKILTEIQRYVFM